MSNPEYRPISSETLLPPPEEHLALPKGSQPPVRPRRTSAWLWIVALVLISAIVYLYWDKKNAARADSQEQRNGPPATPVVAAKATKGDIGVYFDSLGTVTPISTVTVKSRVDGQLDKVLYKEGDSIREGDLLAEIDPRPFQAALTQAEGQLLKDQASLENARTDLARYEELLTHNAVPEQQLATQRATVAQDEGIVKSDEGQVENAKLNLAFCQITAPSAGQVGLRLVDPGNMVHASDANGLLVITQVQPMSVIFTLAEDQLPPVLQKFRAKQRLQVDAYDRGMTAKIATGALATIDNQIDQTTGTVKLRATFDNKDGALFPNQFVNVRLLVEEKRGVTLAPSAVIQRNTQKTYVYLVKPDSTVTIRDIQVGTTEGDQSQITSGLSPGDVLVLAGTDRLQEGSKVSAQFRGEPAQGQEQPTQSEQSPGEESQQKQSSEKGQAKRR